MKSSDWLTAVQVAADKYFLNSPFHIEVIRGTRVKIRIEIGNEIFADLFFREETGRIDYTLIFEGRRFYGMDNLGGWHEHPVGMPETHRSIEEPNPEEAIRNLRNAVEILEAG